MSGEHKEPSITINGVELTTAQAMTVRVAIENFASSLAGDGLGDDAEGRELCAGYLARIGEIRAAMYRPEAKG